MPGIQIFKTLKRQRVATFRNARKWESFACKETSALEQLHFLHNCK